MPSHGTKVEDPNASIHEKTGAVASDSLAAESIRAGEGFSENPHSEPLGVKGSNSTFANTDTSGAKQLDAAPDSETRKAQSEFEAGDKATSYPDAAGGQSKSLAVENTTGSFETGGETSAAGTAPSYVGSKGDGGKPKGKNLTEGGFESDDTKNASFTAEIGSKDDPGRVAEAEMQRGNAERDAL